MSDLRLDIRYALRQFAKRPGFTFLAVLTLALGIGLNASVFSLVNAVLFKPPPVEQPDELVHLYTKTPSSAFSHEVSSFPDYLDLANQATSFSGVTAYAFSTFALETEDTGELIFGQLASGNFFSVFGVQPQLGRAFTPEDDSRGAAQPAAVVSHAAWQRRFGGDPEVIGKTVRLNGHVFTIVGVAPEGFVGPFVGLAPELWVPIRMASTIHAGASASSGTPTPGLDRLDDRALRWTWITARRAPGIDFEHAAAELDTLTTRLEAAHPDTNTDRAFLMMAAKDVRLLPWVDGKLAAGSWVLLGVVALVLLIACSNLANMLLARAVSRRKEMATRLALGAGRGAILRQLLTESLLLALAGAAGGLALAAFSNRVLMALELPIPIDLGLTLDLRVVAFTIAAAMVTAVLFGLTPAFEATRVQLAGTLHDASRGSTGGRRVLRLRNGLVVAEVAFSLVLLICAGLSVRSMRNAHLIDPGFRADGLVTAAFAPHLQGYDIERADAFYNALAERLEGQPEIHGVTYASHLPLSTNLNLERVRTPSQMSVPEAELPLVDSALVSPGYFSTLGIELRAGRGFQPSDDANAPRVAVVNASFAQQLFPGVDPLGQRFQISDAEVVWEIVGVAADGKYRTLGEAPRSFLYQPIAQAAGSTSRTLVVRSDTSTNALGAIRQASRELDPRMAVAQLQTVQDAMGTAFAIPRMAAVAFGLFGALGMILAAIGLYGVLSYLAGQRTQEVGIRMAMGAGRGEILRLLLRDGLRLTLVGTVLGLGLAMLVARGLSAMLYGISPTDLVTYLAVSGFLLAVALLASIVPARRAARVDPMKALRWE